MIMKIFAFTHGSEIQYDNISENICETDYQLQLGSIQRRC